MKTPLRAPRAAVWVPLALAASAVGAAQVEVLTPPPGTPVFGEIEITLDVRSADPIEWVDILLDGRRVARFEEPPYRATVDVGQYNIEHRIKAIVRTVFGDLAETVRTTPRVEVDLEVDVELQQLFVVVEQGGRRVLGLPKASFTVTSDTGRREEIVTFGGGDLPISAALLVDSSESMKGARLDAAVDGAQAFATGMRGDDEAMMVLFSDRILKLTPFTGDAETLAATVQGVRAAGGTSVNDHLYFSLNRLESRLGRRVIVLLSDGVDISSVLPMREVLWRARRSQVVIYWIRLVEGQTAAEEGEEIEEEDVKKGPRFSSTWRDVEQNGEEYRLIQRMVKDTGGRILDIEWIGEIENAFREILRELREQYVLGFYPSNRRHDGSWRRVNVRVRDGYNVRTRSGFVDY